MKKVKALALVAIFAGSMLNAPTAEARKTGGGTKIVGNCVITYETHSYLFGLINTYTETSKICGDTPIQFEDVISHT